MSIATVRTAMAAALATIPGLSTDAYITDHINPPHAMIDFGIAPYDLTFTGNSDEYQFVVQVFLVRTAERDSQQYADTLRDPGASTSIKNVLEADAGLAAVVQYAQVQSVTEMSAVTVQQADYLFMQFTVEVVI